MLQTSFSLIFKQGLKRRRGRPAGKTMGHTAPAVGGHMRVYRGNTVRVRHKADLPFRPKGAGFALRGRVCRAKNDSF